MKTKSFLSVLFMLVMMGSYAQTRPKIPSGQCYFDHHLEQIRQAHPEITDVLNHMDEEIRQRVSKGTANSGQLKSANANVVIPVVVYIVHNNGPENITDNQVLSQINALNAYFDLYGIQFCLATANGSAPLPGPTPGILRIQNAGLTDVNADTEHTALAATSTLSDDRYLRIWVVQNINGGTANGYSFLPNAEPLNGGGIVMDYNAFGDIATCGCTTLANSTQNGRVLVHEVGHYLGLYHTFEGNCSGMSSADCDIAGDRVCDTPPVQNPNAYCNPNNSCMETNDLPDDISNYMDYTSETCLTHFSDGQVNRMHAMISLYRSMLVSSENHTHTGVNCTGGLLAGFTIDNPSPCVGATVNFSAAPVSGATYTWDFGDGVTASGQNVSHNYTSSHNPAGVTLTVTIGSNSVSAVKPVFVEPCSPINSTEAHWYFYQRNALDFSNGSPVYDNSAELNNTMAIAGQYGVHECSATQSDANGNLLFYTNGQHVWNNQHQYVSGAYLYGDFSSMNGVMIVPDPANTSLYYVFTTDVRYSGSRGLNYSKIMATSTTPAAVVPGQLNVPIPAPAGYGFEVSTSTGSMIAGEGITSVRHANGYWMIFYAVGNQDHDYLLVYNLTANGLSLHNVYTIGQMPFALQPGWSMACDIQASPDGKRLALTPSTGYDQPDYVFDFDPCQGVISNRRELPTPYPRNLSAPEFSPNSRFLYGTVYGKIYQYDLKPCTINVQLITDISPMDVRSMQRGPNNKIYGSVWGTNQMTTIHRPDSLCTSSVPNACVFINSGPALVGSQTSGLPNMIDANQAPQYSNTILASLSTCSTGCYSYDFEADVCTGSYSWNFGDAGSGSANFSNERTPTHAFSGPGTYTITCNAGGTLLMTTVQVGSVAPISGSPYICPSTSMQGTYSIAVPTGYTVQWSAIGGTISGLPNQSSVVINWSSLPGSVQAIVTDQTLQGCSYTSTFSVTQQCVVTCPCALSADFNHQVNQSSCSVNFTGLAEGNSCTNAVSYTWDFGDGTTGTGANPNHTYTTPGAYYVCLTITATNGTEVCEQEVCKYIEVDCATECQCTLNPQISVNFDSKTCTYTFTAAHGGPSCLGGVDYFWDFSDGTTATGQTVSNTYAQPGGYTVCVYVNGYNEDGTECSQNTCVEVEPNCASSCACEGNLDFGFGFNEENCTLYLDGFIDGNTCPENEFIEYTWDFGDGTTSNAQSPSHMYSQPGWYGVCLTAIVYDMNGERLCDKQVCKEVEITCGGDCPCELKPDIKYDVDEKTCTYYFEGMHGGPECLTNVQYFWDFGDGTTAYGQSPDHVYMQPGSYDVCLTVTVYDNNGERTCEDKVCIKVDVECNGECECKLAPNMKIELDKETCYYTFTGFHGGPECLQFVEYFWDFGDGTTSIGQVAGHVYSQTGTYEVCLYVEVKNEKGERLCSKKICKEVKVTCKGDCDCKLEPSYSLTPLGSCEFLFTANPPSPCANIKDMIWVVNGQQVAQGSYLVQTMNVNESYEVCLHVLAYTDGEECEEKYCDKFFFTDCYPSFRSQEVTTELQEGVLDATLFPNPAQDAFSIQFSERIEAEVHVVLKSIDGKLLKEEILSTTDANVISIPEAIGNGLIIVEVTTGDKRFTKKLLVMRK